MATSMLYFTDNNLIN